MTRGPCEHAASIKDPPPNTPGECEDCVRIGDTWVHLRECEECGKVGCCDSSKNKHATRHYHASGHPVIKSLEPGERWKWCYVDEAVWE